MLYNCQYVFREGHSTEYATLELVDMDKKTTPVHIFLDLSKAFETLDHHILIKKLEYNGLYGISLQLIDSFLTNKKQFVEIDVKLNKLTLNIMKRKYIIFHRNKKEFKI